MCYQPTNEPAEKKMISKSTQWFAKFLQLFNVSEPKKIYSLGFLALGLMLSNIGGQVIGSS